MGQASAPEVKIAALAAASMSASAVVASRSAAVASTSGASAFARTPTKAADRFADIYTDSEDEANRKTQSKTGGLTFNPKKTPLVNLTPDKTSKQKKKKPNHSQNLRKMTCLTPTATEGK